MSRSAFGAIELIGVLAILVILTALLFPRLSRKANAPDPIQTVSEAKVIEASIAIQSLQSAITAHLAQFGGLASQNGTALTFTQSYDQFGQVLLSEGLIEKPFAVRLGTSSRVCLLRVSGLSFASPVDAFNGAYDLNGKGRNEVVGEALVAEAVISGVSEAGAKALNDQVDGPQLAAAPGQDDLRGRVIYRKAGADGNTEVHVYLTAK
jgi:hypothetical protein